MEYFSSVKVNSYITCIKGLTGEMMYLIHGGKKAALVDTGLGVGNIREYVGTLTDLPYIVLLTHGHLDHVGGAYLYDSVYIDPKDVTLLREGGGIEPRREYLESIVKDRQVPDEAYVPVKNVRAISIADGQLFDLGGLTIEAISFPGHTPGSLAFLIKEDRILITGDACNTFTFMFLPESLNIEDYQKAVGQIIKRESEYDFVFLSHGSYEVPKSVIQEVYDCCTDILKGRADDISFSFMSKGTAYIAKKVEGLTGRQDGKYGNIVYDKENLFHR